MADDILEMMVAVSSRCCYGMLPFEFSIPSVGFVRHCRWQTFCTFDNVRITKMAVGKQEVVLTLIWN
jgi:hypothetical protein